MHFGFNNQFIKVKRILAKISKKTTKILFLFKIWGMSLYVIHIPDINYYYYYFFFRTWDMTLHVMRIPNNYKPQQDFRFYQTKQCSLP